MPRHHPRLIGWIYDDHRQQIHTPAGAVIPLTSIAQRFADDIACRYDFAGPWKGWRMRGDRLLTPYSTRAVLKPTTAPLFLRWVDSPRPLLIPYAAPRAVLKPVNVGAGEDSGSMENPDAKTRSALAGY